MRSTAIIASMCLGLAACGTTHSEDNPYLKPNELMAREIDNRISQIPFQQREELFNNLLWLAQTGEQAIPSLLTALEHNNAKVRSNALWVLGRIRDRRAIPQMQPLVQDQDSTVRLEAARTLVLMGDLQHTPSLIDGLDSDRVQVRYLCHEALRQATGREFGYDHLADNLASRNQATYRWRKWWSDQSGDPWFAKDYAADRGLDVFEAENDWRIGSKPGGETVNLDDETQGEQPEMTENPDSPEDQGQGAIENSERNESAENTESTNSENNNAENAESGSAENSNSEANGTETTGTETTGTETTGTETSGAPQSTQTPAGAPITLPTGTGEKPKKSQKSEGNGH